MNKTLTLIVFCRYCVFWRKSS